LTGLLPPWGRPRPYPPIHDSVPGGGLAKDRAPWRPSRAHVFVPVTALSPRYRALCKQELAHAGLLERIATRGGNSAWHVPSQAKPNGHTACTYLALSVFQGALAHRRIVSLQDRTVPFTSRNPGRARPRTTPRDVIECIRRCLPHVLPAGVLKVRPFGFMHTRGALPTETRRRILRHPPVALKAPAVEAPAPCLAAGPTCGTPLRLVRRLWTSTRVFLATG
jgi:hypothetical protein